MSDVPGHNWVEASNDSEEAHVPLARGRIDGFRRHIAEAEEASGSLHLHHDPTASPPNHEAGIHAQGCGVEAVGASRSHRRDGGREDNDEGRR